MLPPEAKAPTSTILNIPLPSATRLQPRRILTPKKVRHFNHDWLNDPRFKSFLEYDIQKNVMYCTDCKKHYADSPNAGPLVTGSSNFRVSSLVEHIGTINSPHNVAVQRNNPANATLLEVKKAVEEKKFKSAISALKTVFWLAKEEVANLKYGSLIDFQRDQGVQDLINLHLGGNATYTSSGIHKQLLECINTVLVSGQLDLLQKSPVVSIGLDESTDRVQEKHVLFCCRYFDTNKAQLSTEFLKVKEVDSGKAEAVFNSLQAVSCY